MKYKKDFKTQLRHYSIVNQLVLNDEPPITLTLPEKLAKLRVEQARAAANRQLRRQQGSASSIEQQQQSTYYVHPWLGLSFPIDDPGTDVQQHVARQVAGPRPPPSWIRRRPTRRPTTPPTVAIDDHFSLQQYQSQRHGRYKSATLSTVPSLVCICCRQLATDQIKQLPTLIKQRILFEWSIYDSDKDDGCQQKLTNATVKAFEKTEYDELWLEASRVSLERLIRAFWKIDNVTGTAEEEMDSEPVDDWEDLLDDHGHATTTLENSNTLITIDDHDHPPTVVLHLDQQEEIGKWEYLSQVVAVLQRQQRQQQQLLESAIISPSYALSSPFLGRTLVSLNISFMRPAPSSVPVCWTTFAHLVVSTLPGLQWLYSAGCFYSSEGSDILPILSHGLRKLKFWDLGYHSWLQLDELTLIIEWHRDLTELTTLCLSGSSSTSTDITRWFKDHQLSRIKLIWADE